MKNYDLLTAPVGRTLFFKSLPMFMGIFSSIAYNLVDTFFVGRLGTDELAAMSFSFPVVMIIMNLIFGISMGSASVISQAIGAGDGSLAKRLASKSLELTILFSLLITLAGIFTIEPLFKLLGVSGELMPLVKEYMVCWYAGVIFSNLSMVGCAIFRAKGNVFFPSLMLTLGALLNAVLDPILIFGWGVIPKMGIQGAALTTVIGNALSTFFIFYKLKRNENISIPWFPRSLDWGLWKKIIHIAIPSSMANSLTPIATAVTNRMLVVYGNAAIAANSIATRVETVPFIAIFALGTVLLPFIGQNWGAKNYHRIKEAILKSFGFSYLLGLVFTVVLFLGRSQVAAFFDRDPAVITFTAKYFSMIPTTYGLLGTVFLTQYSMNAISKPYRGNFLSIFRLILLYLPLASVLQGPLGVVGIFESRLIANLVTGVLATLLIWKTFFKIKKLEEPVQESS